MRERLFCSAFATLRLRLGCTSSSTAAMPLPSSAMSCCAFVRKRLCVTAACAELGLGRTRFYDSMSVWIVISAEATTGSAVD